jgi:hypothetical protein
MNRDLTPLAKKKQRETITVRNAYLLWPNFSGNPTKFNPDGGDRGFNIMMGEEDGLHLQQNGWNVSVYDKAADDGDPNVYYKLPVAVKYKPYPPRLWLIGGESATDRVLLDENVVEFLDRLQFEKVDLVIAAAPWTDRSGAKRIKAYLQTGMFTIYVDELEREYGIVQTLGGMGVQPALSSEEDEQHALPVGSRRPYDYDGEVIED